MANTQPWLAAAQAAVDAGELAGAVGLVWQRGQARFVGAVGVRDVQTGAPATRDTVYRVASLTKPVLAVATLLLVEDGLLSLDQAIDGLIPELARPRVLPHPGADLHVAVPATRPLTVRDLLTHRAGLTYAELAPGALGEAYTALGPQLDNPRSPSEWLAQPGTQFDYGHAYDVLGFLLARAAGAPLAEVLRHRVFAPLGMVDTGFEAPDAGRRAGLVGFDDMGALTALAQTPGGGTPTPTVPGGWPSSRAGRDCGPPSTTTRGSHKRCSVTRFPGAGTSCLPRRSAHCAPTSSPTRSAPLPRCSGCRSSPGTATGWG